MPCVPHPTSAAIATHTRPFLSPSLSLYVILRVGGCVSLFIRARVWDVVADKQPPALYGAHAHTGFL